MVVSGLILVAANHADAPAVTGIAAEITGVYTFSGTRYQQSCIFSKHTRIVKALETAKIDPVLIPMIY